MSYTATTIGFGELPWPFSAAQRLWVTFSIYLSVVGWAYAIGSMLTLLQDRSFRQALAFRRFTRKVEGMREPFLLLAGYGRAGELLAKAFDELGQQVVVIDDSSDRVDALDLGSYHADIPGLVADAGNPHHLSAAGLGHPFCNGVLALTNDDETNLAVTMTAALVRPELPVITRTDLGDDRGADAGLRHPDGGQPLRPVRRASAARAERTGVLPAAHLARGRPGRGAARARPSTHRRSLGDVRLRSVRSGGDRGSARGGPRGHRHRARRAWPAGTRSDRRRRVRPDVLARADLASAVGLVAGTDNDTTNLSMLATARRLNPQLFLAARQNRPTSADLFKAMQVDALLVPTEVVAHEVYAQISTPMLWRFIQQMPAQGDQWAAEVIQRLRYNCGRQLPALWKIKLDREQAPSLGGYLANGRVRLTDLVRSPGGPKPAPPGGAAAAPPRRRTPS